MGFVATLTVIEYKVRDLLMDHMLVQAVPMQSIAHKNTLGALGRGVDNCQHMVSFRHGHAALLRMTLLFGKRMNAEDYPRQSLWLRRSGRHAGTCLL